MGRTGIHARSYHEILYYGLSIPHCKTVCAFQVICGLIIHLLLPNPHFLQAWSVSFAGDHSTHIDAHEMADISQERISRGFF